MHIISTSDLEEVFNYEFKGINIVKILADKNFSKLLVGSKDGYTSFNFV